MSITLSTQSAEFIARQVTSGVYPDQSAAVDAAVRLLQAQTEVLSEIDLARQQIESGEYTDYDDDSLAERFEELRQRAMEISRSHAGT